MINGLAAARRLLCAFVPPEARDARQFG